jgi:hypothetical protein
VRITTAQRTENENRIRAAIDRLLRGEIPPGGRCDIKTLAAEAAVDRTAFYGTRPYTGLREEFEGCLVALQQAGYPRPARSPDHPIQGRDRRLESATDPLRGHRG